MDPYILKPLAKERNIERGPRLEIDEFIGDNVMTNLFLLALADMQKRSLEEVTVNGKKGPNWLNYYGLAGIHWAPQEAWDGYKNDEEDGYCHHSKLTFPTWHRPYMLRYEVAIHDKMVEVANAFKGPDQNRYLDAAARFRLPYWDPVMPRREYDPRSTVRNNFWAAPQIFTQERVHVRTPEKPAELTPIDNPLSFYRFPTEREWSERRTVPRKDLREFLSPRYPTDRTRRGPGLDLSVVRQAGSLAVALKQMLQPDYKQAAKGGGAEININEVRPWSSFGTTLINSDFGRRAEALDFRGNEYETVSVEGWHNRVHNLVGGHMGNPEFAGFEPIFWMHHNNIDRFLSLYQALWPNKYLDEREARQELVPFKKDASRACFASKDEFVRSYWGPGFAVPGTKPLDAAAVKRQVTKYITDTYNWAAYPSPDPKTFPKGWPKLDNLRACEALTGVLTPAAPPVATFSTIASVNGEVQLASHVGGAAAENVVVPVASIVESAQAVDQALPAGALLQAPAADRPAVSRAWDAHVRVRKFAFDGSFNVHLFVGRVNDDQAPHFLTRKNEVGFAGIFTSPRESGCASCRAHQAADVLSEDVVSLTLYLPDYLASNPVSAGLITEGTHRTLENLEVGSVVPFLREQIAWRMATVDGALLEGREQEAKLEVTVTSREYESPSAAFPAGRYRPVQLHPEVTDDKPGGFGYVYPPAA